MRGEMAASHLTLKDIAREAGVSVATLDRVLHGRPGVREDTARRVREAIDRHGFRPFAAGAELAKGRSGKFAFVMPDGSNVFMSMILQHIAEMSGWLAARRASVSRLPRPASTRMRVRSDSSKVKLPELPDARMETRKPIGKSPRKTSAHKNRTSDAQQNFQDDGRAMAGRQCARKKQDRNGSRSGIQQASRERSREKPLRGPRTVAAIRSGWKNCCARAWRSSRVTASIAEMISSRDVKRWK